MANRLELKLVIQEGMTIGSILLVKNTTKNIEKFIPSSLSAF